MTQAWGHGYNMICLSDTSPTVKCLDMYNYNVYGCRITPFFEATDDCGVFTTDETA